MAKSHDLSFRQGPPVKLIHLDHLSRGAYAIRDFNLGNDFVVGMDERTWTETSEFEFLHEGAQKLWHLGSTFHRPVPRHVALSHVEVPASVLGAEGGDFMWGATSERFVNGLDRLQVRFRHVEQHSFSRL